MENDMREYTITIHFTTSEPDYTGVYGKQNLINDIVERLGCDESDIDIEYDVEPETE